MPRTAPTRLLVEKHSGWTLGCCSCARHLKSGAKVNQVTAKVNLPKLLLVASGQAAIVPLVASETRGEVSTSRGQQQPLFLRQWQPVQAMAAETANPSLGALDADDLSLRNKCRLSADETNQFTTRNWRPRVERHSLHFDWPFSLFRLFGSSSSNSLR